MPAGTLKKELLDYVDQIPTYVQQLQFTVKNPTVGKAATFTKVDAVIQETKNCMNCVSKVVSTCFECANKVNHFEKLSRSYLILSKAVVYDNRRIFKYLARFIKLFFYIIKELFA